MNAPPPAPRRPLTTGDCAGLRHQAAVVILVLSLTIVITAVASVAFHADWVLARAAIALSVLWVAWAWFCQRVLARIERLVRAMTCIAEGDLSVRLHDDRQDELGIAARELNRMAETIAAGRASLEEATFAARDASRAKTEFLANISHEIRTPMTAILGFADILGEHVTQPDNLVAVETIRRNGRYLLELINDLLDLSKIEAGKLEVERIPCSPRRILNDVVSLMRLRADEKGLSLVVRYSGPIPARIQTDPTRLRQILINLVGNAIKFTDEGLVEVVARVLPAAATGDSARLQIDVSDTGTGISPDQMARLFAPFSQGDASVSRRFGGTGLGLTICKRLTQMLGGTISVESEPGAGSCFTVIVDAGPLDGVPMIEDPAGQSTCHSLPPLDRELSPRPTGLSGRVLLAEDGPDNQRLLLYLLKKAGLEVTLATNGRDAIDRALSSSAARPFDVVLMDIQMPEIDGFAATRELRAAGYTRPIIALTAHAMDTARDRCLEAGCDAYVGKPIDRHELLGALARYLEPADSPWLEPAGQV